MRAAVVVGIVLLCGIAQGAEPPDADRSPGKDRKAAAVATAKQQVVELEKKRLAAVKKRDGGLISALVNDIGLAKIELKEALKKTVEDYAREADAEAEEAARKADAEAKEAARQAKEAARQADAVANLERVNDQFGAVFKTVTNTIDMELIGIPAGKFTMGSPAKKDQYFDEEQVAVTLTKPFWLGKTEVTQGQFKKVMGAAPWFDLEGVQIDKNNPASYVSWNDATAFCQRLTDLERKSGKLQANEEYRLPTEAEWEYACRAGTTTAYSFGNDASQLGQYAWFAGNTLPTRATVVNLDEKIAGRAGEEYAHAVGLKKPNPWGLHDMHGNVWEWCSDRYDKKLSGGIDPAGPGVTSFRVRRGGGWGTGPGYPHGCRSAARTFVDSDPPGRISDLGFRVARSQSAQ